MRLPGRTTAAIEILAEIFERHRPASEALKDWGKAHRFAGSTDRHAIGTLVYDCLRKRNSLSARMGDGRPRALVLGALHDLWEQSAEAIAAMAGEQHGPGALTPAESTALARTMRDDLPAQVQGDLPEWLMPSFTAAFGERAAEEGEALSRRAPIDLRANTLKAAREEVLEALKKYGALPGPLSPWVVRIAPPGPEARNANVEAEPAHGRGWFEVQDAASQVGALMTGARPGESVADICAGSGGKTLALAAMMKNQGRLIAHDSDRHRLRPIFERLTRSGASMVEVIAADEGERLSTFDGFDCVLVDAPCSGSGTWRRKPDGKWRLTSKQLQQRIKEQQQVLERAAKLVKPGGRLVYLTCSVLPEENSAQVSVFLATHRDFMVIPYREQWRIATESEPPVSADGSDQTLLLTPARHETDGFFVAVMKRSG
ncbi:MAG: RsmB/NOP family class I SAM-dependent RNA methyltransferase [Rhizobiales bacterium]|nr:RsmB/NOP family class I SAM-dependent RNA methyltransferase [Hyphomicrobiales bacterium]MBI3672171.1 RsmB/NOP family class I SAM-dependent RNA methyltransferase [Hyphomicrobiales bacterium]